MVTLTLNGKTHEQTNPSHQKARKEAKAQIPLSCEGSESTNPLRVRRAVKNRTQKA